MIWVWIGVFGVVAVAAAAQAVSGFGSALIATPVVAVLVGPHEAVVGLTMVSIVLVAMLSIRSRGHVEGSVVVTVTAAAIVGMPIGLLVLERADDRTLTAIIASVVIVFAVLQWRGPAAASESRDGRGRRVRRGKRRVHGDHRRVLGGGLARVRVRHRSRIDGRPRGRRRGVPGARGRVLVPARVALAPHRDGLRDGDLRGARPARLIHQVDDSKAGLAAVAGVVAILHVAAAVTAVILTRRSRGRGTLSVA